jgi:hypothetical protein
MCKHSSVTTIVGSNCNVCILYAVLKIVDFVVPSCLHVEMAVLIMEAYDSQNDLQPDEFVLKEGTII